MMTTKRIKLIAAIYSLFISITSGSAWWTDHQDDCTCNDVSFFVEYTSSYTRHDKTYGYDVYCYTYLITRSEDYNQHDKCTEEIDFVELGVSTKDCSHQVDDLQHIIVDYGASDVYDCTVTLLRDEQYGILGMRYECDFAPYNDVNIFLCTTIPDSIEDGHIAYVSNGNYGYSCNAPKVPNFCGAPPDHHPPPVVLPTPKPTWPTRQPTPSPTDAPTDNPTSAPTEYPTKSPTSDPTIDPTESPTTDPTTDPTEQPTAAPTEWPTSSPTPDPTIDPTDSPTADPTINPTPSPNMKACPHDRDLDVVFLVDTSCYNGLRQCNDDQKEFLAELFTSIIGPDNPSEAAYIRFDSYQQYVDIALDDKAYDDNISQKDTNKLYNKIRNLPFTNTGGTPNLDAALQEAYKQFDVVAKSDVNDRDKKIIIISNDYLNQQEQTDLCHKHELKIRTGTYTPSRDDIHEGIDVIMVNIGSHAPSNYIACLVQYDQERIYTAPVVQFNPNLSNLITPIQTEVCSEPTPSPTTDPTVDPTTDPTQSPTPDPSEQPTTDPTEQPTAAPTTDPTESPTPDPTTQPTVDPTEQPTAAPTEFPTRSPTTDPTYNPTESPTSAPTEWPTRSPTNDPTTDPTVSPTPDPTTDPTKEPTGSPTAGPTESPSLAPTKLPSPSPTNLPTPSPNMEACENGGKLDVVFLVDASIDLTDDECVDRNEFAAELFTAVKGRKNIVRAAYIRFGAQYDSMDGNGTDDKHINIDIGLDLDPYNTQLPPTQRDMNVLYNDIRTLSCNINTGDSPDLKGGLEAAIDQFDNVGTSDIEGRDKKIVIISNNYVSTQERDEICDKFRDKIRTGMDVPSRGNHGIKGIDVIMVNLGDKMQLNPGYIMCLVEYDDKRIYEEEDIRFTPDLEFLVPEIRDEICSHPTETPTTDPTLDPTPQPTPNPTRLPTVDPTDNPTSAPTENPTKSPTSDPTIDPTDSPTADPTTDPTKEPTGAPTDNPTKSPTASPTDWPTSAPTDNPTAAPTDNPSISPTTDPTIDPTVSPTNDPTTDPTKEPTGAPTEYPSKSPTSDPTKEPTPDPTKSPTSKACPLYDEWYEFAIIVDNSCGLNYDECLIQRDQVAELVSRIKTDNDKDNPKITYIEYNADGANIRISLDNPIQVNTRDIYDFIRNSAVCGDGGDGKTDLVSGLDLAIKEFDMNGNPSAVQKIIMINNCKNTVDEDSYDAYNDNELCDRIAGEMFTRGIDGIAINIPAPKDRVSNTITNPNEYLRCLVDNDSDRVCSGVVDNTITIQEYIDSYNKCVPEICNKPTPSPTTDPTSIPTPDPTLLPTTEPTGSPTSAPTEIPTKSPTTDPTEDPTPWPTPQPTKVPTREPTTSPTTDPTGDPTGFPTPEPTDKPTPSPTNWPTPSPNMEACENGGRLDVVFLVDTSININDDECTEQNEFIAELYTSIKGSKNIVRAAYIRFGAAGHLSIDIALNTRPYNIRDEFPLQSDVNILYNFIRDQPCTDNPGKEPDLDSALQAAYNQFDNVGVSDGMGDQTRRDKKIIIISNNYLTLPKQDEICASNAYKIRTGLDDSRDSPVEGFGINGINVVMVNLRNTAPKNYIMCLVGYDIHRIYEAPVIQYYPELENLVPSLRDEICSSPTPAPTIDPTDQPSIDPTPFPTKIPTEDPSPAPTKKPTWWPTTVPTLQPTTDPTDDPTTNPTISPTVDPTIWPTRSPTDNPTIDPTKEPTKSPTERPSRAPTPKPTRWPTKKPTPKPSEWPTPSPTKKPTPRPTPKPTNRPTSPTWPTIHPTDRPSVWPTKEPTTSPTEWPTFAPSITPTKQPTKQPTKSPSSKPTIEPSTSPTNAPSPWPTPEPTPNPTPWPTGAPTKLPTTSQPTTSEPTKQPTSEPTSRPTQQPTSQPTDTSTTTTTTTTTATTSSAKNVDPTPNPTPNPTSRPVMVITEPCPVCLADDIFTDPYTDDYKGYFAEPKPPKDVQFGHSVGLNMNNNPITNVLYSNQLKSKQVDHEHKIDYSSISYLIVLFIVSCNVILCSWYTLKEDKKENILGYLSGYKTNTKILDEADISDIDDGEYNDEYETTTDLDNDDFTDDESDDEI